MNVLRNLARTALLFTLLASTAGATNFTLSVITQGSGTITTNPTFASYPANVTVTLTATPSAGWYFGGWSGVGGGTTNSLNLTMKGDLSVTGKFLAYPVYAFTLTTNGQGSIGLNPAGGSYASNTLVTATATPAAGWVFTGWSGGTNSTTDPLALSLNGNLALTGNFAQLPAFDVQPRGLTNLVGSAVYFSAHALGTAPVSYQWFLGGGALPGATYPTLSLTNTTPGQAGFYQVVATNFYGAATSSVVALVLTNASGPTNVVSVCDEASLQTAIRAGGWISIGCSGTITLTNTLTITNNVILDGSGVSATLSGGNAVQLFSVSPGAALALTNLTLANGVSIVTNKNAPAAGGAIYNSGGTVTLTGCTVLNNAAQNFANGGTAKGGAICNVGGSVFIYATAISSNSILGGYYQNPQTPPPFGGSGYGGAIFSSTGVMLVSNCVFNGNVSTGNAGGGGMYGGALFQDSGSLVLVGTLLTNNVALGASALFYGFANNVSGSGAGYGGALAASGGTVTINHCQFYANSALVAGAYGTQTTYGGAIYTAANLAVSSSLFTGNQSYPGGSVVFTVDGDGGAIYNLGNASLSQCCLYSNYCLGGNTTPAHGIPDQGGNGLGGGIYNASQLAITNCTVALNYVVNGTGISGGSNGKSYGGGIYNSASGTFLAVNSTLASNSCSVQATGIAAGSQIANFSGSLALRNSLLAYGGSPGNCYGTITDLGDNISSDGSANLNSGSSFNLTNPLLGSLGNNGGATLTMAVQAGSPAIAYANSATAPTVDQRGYARPVGVGVIDLGAYQSSATPIYPPLVLSIATVNPNFRVSFTTSPAITNTLHLQFSTNLSGWTDLATFGALASPSNITQTISPQGAPCKFFRLWW